MTIVGSVAAAVLATGFGVFPALAAPTTAAAAHPAPTWTQYFYPLKVGWTCHESVTQSGVDATETLTVAAVGATPTGQSVTVNVAGSTTVNGFSVPANVALHYLLTKKGELVSVPSAGQLAGQAYHFEGNTTFPDVAALLSGKSSVSRLHIAAPLSQTDLTQLQAVLAPHATSLNMAVELRQSGSMSPVLHLPSGTTFHNVLKVHSTLRQLSFTNVSKSGSKILASELKPVLSKELANTTWYARGRGPVRTQVGGLNGYVTDCGLDGATTSTTS